MLPLKPLCIEHARKNGFDIGKTSYGVCTFCEKKGRIAEIRCSVCEEGVFCLGYCRKHYFRMRRNGTTVAMRNFSSPHP